MSNGKVKPGPDVPPKVLSKVTISKGSDTGPAFNSVNFLIENFPSHSTVNLTNWRYTTEGEKIIPPLPLPIISINISDLVWNSLTSELEGCISINDLSIPSGTPNGEYFQVDIEIEAHGMPIIVEDGTDREVDTKGFA